VGAFDEIERWLGVETYPRRAFGHRELTGLGQGIRVQNLGFHYPNRTVALEDVNFELRVGQTVALVGASGAGKSTLASLLLRLREPTSGSILVDGVDYWEFSPESWHRMVAVVEQEAFLFHDTLAKNVAFGYPAVTEAEIIRALQQANLQEVLEALPEGIHSMVGERGLKLSGGQRQRLAIARAMVRNPQILILDEATSHLDSVTEQLVQKALAEATQGRTTLVIAHRLSTIRHADWIVVMENGRVAEQGVWDTLSARDGLFAKFTQVHGAT
jgi:ABC-type multidrug transport system fused ATPase/permease subunit